MTAQYLFSSLFYLAVAVQLFYLLRYFFPFVFYFKEKKNLAPTPAVSIIIAAHNEDGNLENLIQALLRQDHPEFEIIIANDRSTDSSAAILEKYSGRIRALNILATPDGIHPKKYALQEAISSARYAHLLFTDADCIPRSDSWASGMTSNFSKNKEIVLGYGGFKKASGLLYLLQQYETLYTALQYFSFALAGRTYMGVGRNLAYIRPLFERSDGFGPHENVLGGDDDLTVGQMATPFNVAITLRPDQQTVSEHKKTWREWWHQKRRHLSVSQHYASETKLILGLLHMSHAIVYISFLGLIWNGVCKPQMIALFLMRIGCVSIALKILGDRVKEKTFWVIFPALDAIYIIYLAVTGIVAKITKTERWK